MNVLTKKVHSLPTLQALFGKLPDPNLSLPELGRWVRDWMCNEYEIDVWDINHGYCFIWAYLVDALTPIPLTFISSEGHIALYDGALFYDSDHTEGSAVEEELFGYVRYTRSLSRDAAVVFWAHCGLQRIPFRRIVRKLEPDTLLKEIKNLSNFKINIPQAVIKVELAQFNRANRLNAVVTS